MLFGYWQQEKDKGNLTALYFVGGHDKDNASVHRFLLVPAEELDATKARFSKITSCHIYSLQRSLPQVSLIKVKVGTSLLGRMSEWHWLCQTRLCQDPESSLYTTDYDVVRESLDATARLGLISCDGIELKGEEPLAPQAPPRLKSGESWWMTGDGELISYSFALTSRLAWRWDHYFDAAESSESSLSRTPTFGSSAYKRVGCGKTGDQKCLSSFVDT